MSPSPRGVAAITERFGGLRAAGRTALIPYVTAGFPNAAATVDLMHRFERAGADLLELGIPFSDPIADGPTIQAASQRALAAGTDVNAVLGMLSRFREGSTLPVVLFGYLNPILAYGVERFLEDATKAGADGLLLTDLPMGVDPELEARLEASRLALIRLVAPTTPPARARLIARSARGFIYYVSRTGVTGAGTEPGSGLARDLDALHDLAPVPVVVGFGISTPSHAATVGARAEGVVVGSALIDALQRDGRDAAEALLRAMRGALDASDRAST